MVKRKLKILISTLLIGLTVFAVMPSCNNAMANQTNDKPSIMLDYSHRDTVRDQGAYYNGYAEDKLAGDITELVAKELSNKGYNISFTRNRNESISINQRINKVNNSNADLYVSIHCNSSENPTANGFETYANLKGSSSELAHELQQNVTKDLQLTNRGFKGNKYYIKYIDKDSVLIEAGFLQGDIDKLVNNQQQYASSIVRSIENTYSQRTIVDMGTKDVTAISYQHETKQPTKTFNMVMVNGSWDFIEINN